MEQHPEVTPAVVSDGFSIDFNKTNVLIQQVQSHDKRDKDGVVKVGGQKTVIPAGQTREIKCNVRTGPLSIKQEVLFEPDEIPKWPEGLTITETVICLSKGNWSKVAIPVTNDGNYNIVLTPRTILGHIQRVKSIYQVDVRPACTNAPLTQRIQVKRQRVKLIVLRVRKRIKDSMTHRNMRIMGSFGIN